MVAAIRTALNDVSSFVSSFERVPKCVNVSCIVLMRCGRGTVEGFDGLNWVTTNDMFVVAVVLGKGFLEDRTVDGFVW